MKTCTVCGTTKDATEFPARCAKCRPCQKAYLRQWQMANRDRIRAERATPEYREKENQRRRERYATDANVRARRNEASRRTYRDHRERWREYHRARYAALTEDEKRERSERTRSYYQENRDRISAQKRAYYEENRERFVEWHDRWKAENPERYREHLRNGKMRRRAREAALPVVDDVSRAAIIARDGGRCHFCGKRVPESEIHLDHLVPVSWDESEHSARNLAVSHKACNLKSGPGRLPAQLRLVG